MNAGHSDRRPVRIRRRGRHTAPSQVEKVAERAGKAAPAVAIAGALVAGPQAQHALAATDKPAAAATDAKTAGEQQTAPSARATLDSFATHSVTVASRSAARHAARARSTRYTVRSGDTLSTIAEHYYGRASAWRWLYQENARTIANPNLIYVGEQLVVPASAPAHYTVTAYRPRHAKPPAPVSGGDGDGDRDGGTRSGHGGSGGSASGGGGGAVTHSGHGSSGGLSGTLGCSGLERLWDAAGGNPAHAFMAAEIAMAESGGNQYAHSPTADFGYWQINASHGSLATYDAYGNARAAIIISSNGTDWSPWTTYNTGAYQGRC